MKLLNDLSAALPIRARGPMSLKELTTLKTGGEAPLFLEPRNPEEFSACLEVLHRERIPSRVIGGGSNILIPDEGFSGCVFSTRLLRKSQRSGPQLRVEAGVSLPGLVHEAAEWGLSGLEGFVGIPGSLGGAARMNSGGRFGEIWNLISEIEAVDPQGKRRMIRRAEAKPVYRDGGLGDLICLSLVLDLQHGNSQEIQKKTAEVLAQKAAAQPLTERSAGCIFKNPAGQSAGKLVEQAGCKGWSEGGAAVSEKHGNFIVNRGGASAAQVHRLIQRVQSAVREKFDISLELEIVIW